MSAKTDKFENDLEYKINNFPSKKLPAELPTWITDLGLEPNINIKSARRVGGAGGKTDVIINMEGNYPPLKISAKLSNADYFGNWYSHKRILNEFGSDAFEKLTIDCTDWANNTWKSHEHASIFVGVSVCFGKRTGDTSREFTDVFAYEDIRKIVAGVGGVTDESVANCLYISSKLPENIDEFIAAIAPINEEVIRRLSGDFKIAYRPINPMTEGSNRGKGAYTQFKPHAKLPVQKEITTLCELNDLGTFETVTPGKSNHNNILKTLEKDFNIKIPKKT